MTMKKIKYFTCHIDTFNNNLYCCTCHFDTPSTADKRKMLIESQQNSIVGVSSKWLPIIKIKEVEEFDDCLIIKATSLENAYNIAIKFLKKEKQ